MQFILLAKSVYNSSRCATHINSLRPRQNGRHFADDIFKCILVNENVRISIKTSLKIVPKGPINIIPAMFQIMAWRRPGDKPLSEAMLVSLPTHICVTWPQWVNYGPGVSDIIVSMQCLKQQWLHYAASHNTIHSLAYKLFFAIQNMAYYFPSTWHSGLG